MNSPDPVSHPAPARLGACDDAAAPTPVAATATATDTTAAENTGLKVGAAAPHAQACGRRRGRHATTARNSWRPAPIVWSTWDKISTAVIVVLAFITRFTALTRDVDKSTPIFDEKHYVPQAWDMVRSWIDPVTGGIELNPGYGLVVHPPLGKQIMAIPEMIFGYTPLGWRVAGAIFGVITVIIIMETARVITRSGTAATIAGLIACLDGVLLTGSRYGMLDIFIVTFIAATALCLALDRHVTDKLLDRAADEGLVAAAGPWGPRIGVRWWRFAAGVCLGLALSVKWSGLYYMAFFGVLIVTMDYLSRRRHGVTQPLRATLFRDALPSFLAFVVMPVLMYFWAWRAWFAEETSVYRHSFSTGKIPTDSPLRALPESIASFFSYHHDVLKFHESVTSSSGHHHPWDSKPWSWLAAVRPVLYSSDSNATCLNGGNTCKEMVYLFGIPALWWVTVPLVLWCTWRLLAGRDRRFTIPVVGFLAGFIPWVIAYDRQMYFFYAEPLVPFTAVMVALAAITIASTPAAPVSAKLPWLTWPRAVVVLYLSLVVWMFVYFSPLLYGIPISGDYFDSLMWLPSWK